MEAAKIRREERKSGSVLKSTAEQNLFNKGSHYGNTSMDNSYQRGSNHMSNATATTTSGFTYQQPMGEGYLLSATAENYY